jgi:hypothetical protein
VVDIAVLSHAPVLQDCHCYNQLLAAKPGPSAKHASASWPLESTRVPQHSMHLVITGLQHLPIYIHRDLTSLVTQVWPGVLHVLWLQVWMPWTGQRCWSECTSGDIHTPVSLFNQSHDVHALTGLPNPASQVASQYLHPCHGDMCVVLFNASSYPIQCCTAGWVEVILLTCWHCFPHTHVWHRRWAEANGLKVRVTDRSVGEEAGIKSVDLEVGWGLGLGFGGRQIEVNGDRESSLLW